MSKQQVAILMGSDSDLDIMQETANVLDQFKVGYCMHVLSAHRSPEAVHDFVKHAPAKGIKVFIAAAGGAAHLAGVVESLTILPVIGVPIPFGALNGLDALLSTVQMPSGVPVATVAIGKTGAANAGYLAVKILSLSEPTLADKLKQHKKDLESSVQKKDAKLQDVLNKRSTK
jgi:phosphoribosylaminoimidazole carboxylase PurE protein